MLIQWTKRRNVYLLVLMKIYNFLRKTRRNYNTKYFLHTHTNTNTVLDRTFPAYIVWITSRHLIICKHIHKHNRIGRDQNSINKIYIVL